MHESVLVIACGALAREIAALKRHHGWDFLHMQCIDARLHNRPALIPGRVREKIRQNADRYDRIYVAYADCGTGGSLDKVLEEEGVERLPGAHCYQFFAGAERFDAIADAVPGTFYLTDFLARNFDKLVIRPLGLDTHPELRSAYFGNYCRLMFISQTHDPELVEMAQRAAERLDLEYCQLHSGYGGLEQGLKALLTERKNGQEDPRILA